MTVGQNLNSQEYQTRQVVGADLIVASGGKVLLVELVRGYSTSGIVARSRRGET